MTTAAGDRPAEVDARLASIIGSAPKLAPLRQQLPKLSLAQKEALLARLLSLEPKASARRWSTVTITQLVGTVCRPGSAQAGRSPRRFAVMNICSPAGPNGE